MNSTAGNQYQNLAEVLRQILEIKADVKSIKHLSGGCINETLLVKTDQGPFFVKSNDEGKHNMFLAESKGLVLLKDYSQFIIPEVYGCGISNGRSYLILQYIDSAPPGSRYWATMGTYLAALHRHQHDQFGLSYNNYIGSLPQNNDFREHWIDFFIENRLEVQLRMALSNGLITQKYAAGFRNIYSHFADIFPPAKPSLLHGDLWSGNVMTAADGMPCLIDPAVYYGHREMEIAFTRMFGGFDNAFYDSYQEAFPMEAGFWRREEVYNLYPLLVHLNLFGPSYLNGIGRVIRKFQ